MIITKQFIKDIKASNSAVIRFNGKYSRIDLFHGSIGGDERRVITYEFNGELVGYTGNWHLSVYFSTIANSLTTFIMSLRVNDTLDFVIENYQTSALKTAGFYSYILNGRVKRHKKDGITLASINQYFIDTQTCEDNSALNVRPEMGSKENNIYVINS